ncbi:MAG: hypothetical protein IJ205_09465 [Bacteroidales bacterium]|nr:hypothetical protein [Bacteroidales bacterium]
MRGRLLIIIIAAVLASCSRPSSYEPFVMKEKAEYGDTYPFVLDLSDTTVSYSLDFYTRLERPAFGEFPDENLVLDLRWFSPSDSIFADTTFIKVGHPLDSAYYSRDFITTYRDPLSLPESGEWRLKVKVVNDAQSLRGLGLVLKRY